MGDIGTHAAHLAEYITGLKITRICADLNIMVQGRALDDDGNVLLKFDNGAAGVLMEMTTEMSGFNASVDASKMEVPAGFKQVESDMKKALR